MRLAGDASLAAGGDCRPARRRRGRGEGPHDGPGGRRPLHVAQNGGAPIWNRPPLSQRPRNCTRRPARSATTRRSSRSSSRHTTGSGDSKRSSLPERSPPARAAVVHRLLMGGKRKEQALGLFVKQATERNAWSRCRSSTDRSGPGGARTRRICGLRKAMPTWSRCSNSRPKATRIRDSGSASTAQADAVPLSRADGRGRYRLLPLGDEACLGAAALDRLAAGDIPGAKRGWNGPGPKSSRTWGGSTRSPLRRSPISGGNWNTTARSTFAWPPLPCCRRGHARSRLFPSCWKRRGTSRPLPRHADRPRADASLRRCRAAGTGPENRRAAAQRSPRVKELQLYRLEALQLMGRRDEALQGVRDYLGKAHGNSWQDTAVAALAGTLGRVRTRSETTSLAVSKGIRRPRALHALAWYAVVGQHVDNQARDDALKALENVPPRTRSPAAGDAGHDRSGIGQAGRSPRTPRPLPGSPVRPIEQRRLVRPGPAGRALSTGRHRCGLLPQGDAPAQAPGGRCLPARPTAVEEARQVGPLARHVNCRKPSTDLPQIIP